MPVLLSPSRRVSPPEWVQAVLLAANLAWTGLGLGGYRPEVMMVSCMLTALSVVLHFAWRAVVTPPLRWHGAGWLFVPFLLYALANVLWVTPTRWLGWRDWLGWAQMIVVFWIVVNDLRSRGPRKMLFLALVGVAAVGAGMACYQRFVRPDWLMLGVPQVNQYLNRSTGSFSIPNSFAALLVLLLPAAALPLWRRSASAVQRVAWGYLAALLLLALGLTLSRGAWLAVLVATAVWPLAMAGRRWRRRVGVSLAIVAAAGAALVALYFTMPAARERLDFLLRDWGEKSRPGFWHAGWQIFRAHPAFGSGAGSYAVAFEPFRPEQEPTDPEWTHNDYLNTLSDYGLVGFGLFFGACAVVIGRCARRRASDEEKTKTPASTATERDWLDSRAFNTALAIGLLAFGLHLLVDFHLKVPALAMAAASIAGLAVIRAWPDHAANPIPGSALRWRFGAGFAALALGGAGLLWVLPYYRAEAIRRPHRVALNALAHQAPTPEQRRTVATAAREGCSRAIACDPGNAQAWADRAYAAAILAYDDRTHLGDWGKAAEIDARRALALSTAIPEFWLRLGVALDMQGRWAEAGPAFDEALRLAPVNATTWFYFAYHLSLNPVSVPRARAAIATSLRLDPSRVESQTLRQQLAAPH